MSTRDQATADNSQTAPRKEKGPSFGSKATGLVNIIHGTGELIRGHTLEAGDFDRRHGDGKAIAAAGRERVERGLDKFEGKPTKTKTSAANGGGVEVGDGKAAVSGRDPNAPQAPTAAAAPRADLSAKKAREEGAVHPGGYPADKGTTTTGGAVGGDVRSDQYPDEQTGRRPTPGDRLAAVANGSSGQHDANVESMRTSGDRDKQPRDAAHVPLPGNTMGQEQPLSGPVTQTEERGHRRPAETDSG